MIFRFAIALCIFLPASIDAGVLARFKMNNSLGTIDVELFEQDKPVTVQNFISYVKVGAWHDTMIQRWHPGFVIQGGHYFIPDAGNLMTPTATNRLAIQPFGSIPFEMNVGRFLSNTYGTLAMARGADTNSASTDWFFNLANNSSQLDPAGSNAGYVVFGRTLRGTNTLNYFNTGKSDLFPINDSNLPAGSYLPVYSPDGAKGYWVNMDITLLTAAIARARGAIEISWNSVEGKQNIVEFTTVIPAAWQTLQSVAGTGDRMTVVDPAANDTMRQYRVRIDYSN